MRDVSFIHFFMIGLRWSVMKRSLCSPVNFFFYIISKYTLSEGSLLESDREMLMSSIALHKNLIKDNEENCQPLSPNPQATTGLKAYATKP